MLTIFIFISSSIFYSKVLPFIVSFLKRGSNFLLFCFYCFYYYSHKKWGLEFLIKLFLKGRAHNCTSSKTAIPSKVFPSGGTGGPPMSAMSPIKSKNCPHPPIFVDHDKKVFRYFFNLCMAKANLASITS